METVIVEQAQGIVTVTMNRPDKRNAANAVMWRELHDSFDDIASRDEDRVMVLTGAGGAFCSGADLSDLTGPNGEVDPPTLMRQVGEAALALHRLPKPTIAKVNGMAVGAGCNMALACDLVVASDDARFCEIFPTGGCRSISVVRGCCPDWSDCTGPRSCPTSATWSRPRLRSSWV